MRTHSASRHQVVSFAFSPSGRMFATKSRGCYEEKRAVLRDAITGEEVYKFTGHVGGVASMAFSPDGRTFASGGVDGTIILRDSSLISPRGGEGAMTIRRE